MANSLTATLPQLLREHRVVGFGVGTQGCVSAKTISLKDDFSLEVSFADEPSEGDAVCLSVEFENSGSLLSKFFVFAEGEWVEEED